MNVYPTTPTTAISIVATMPIPNVLVEFEPGVHENVVDEPNVDDVVEEDGNRMDEDEVQPFAPHIHSLPNDVPLARLLTPSRQPIETTPPIPAPHVKGMPKSICKVDRHIQ